MKKDLEKQLDKQLQGPLTDKQWKYFKSLCEHQLIELDENALKPSSNFMIARHWFHIGWRAKKVLKKRKQSSVKQ